MNVSKLVVITTLCGVTFHKFYNIKFWLESSYENAFHWMISLLFP